MRYNTSFTSHKLNDKRNKSIGFTLIELLLTISILGVLVASFVITYRSSRNNQALRTSAERLADVVRNAHVFAREAADKEGWGVVRESETTYVLVSGKESDWEPVTRYSLERNTSFVDDFTVWFDIGTGETSANRIITIHADSGKQISVEIIQTGVVEISTIQ